MRTQRFGFLTDGVQIYEVKQLSNRITLDELNNAAACAADNLWWFQVSSQELIAMFFGNTTEDILHDSLCDDDNFPF